MSLSTNNQTADSEMSLRESRMDVNPDEISPTTKEEVELVERKIPVLIPQNTFANSKSKNVKNSMPPILTSELPFLISEEEEDFSNQNAEVTIENLVLPRLSPEIPIEEVKVESFLQDTQVPVLNPQIPIKNVEIFNQETQNVKRFLDDQKLESHCFSQTTVANPIHDPEVTTYEQKMDESNVEDDDFQLPLEKSKLSGQEKKYDDFLKASNVQVFEPMSVDIESTKTLSPFALNISDTKEEGGEGKGESQTDSENESEEIPFKWCDQLEIELMHSILEATGKNYGTKVLLTGISRHFTMIGIANRFKNSTGIKVTCAQIWDKIFSLFKDEMEELDTADKPYQIAEIKKLKRKQEFSLPRSPSFESLMQAKLNSGTSNPLEQLPSTSKSAMENVRHFKCFSKPASKSDLQSQKEPTQDSI